jgi:hypothetical protein
MTRLVAISVFIFFAISASVLYAQNWVGLGKGVSYSGEVWLKTDTKNNLLWLHGRGIIHNNLGDTLNGLGAWDGEKIKRLTKGNNHYNSYCYQPYYFNDTLFTDQSFQLDTFPYGSDYGRYFDEIDSSFKPYPHGFDATIYVDKTLYGKRYFGGKFWHAHGIETRGWAVYDGSSWSALIDTIHAPNYDDYYMDIEMYKGELYIAGNFDGYDWNDEKVYGIGTVDNGRFKKVGNGFIPGMENNVMAIEVYKDELYIAGFFSEAEGNGGNYIMRWDGETLRDVGGGAGWWISSMLVHNGLLFVGGGFKTVGGVYSPRVAYWDGIEWHSLSTDDFGDQFGVYDMEIYNNELYISGSSFYLTINGDSLYGIAKYNRELPYLVTDINVFINNENETININYGNQGDDGYNMLINFYNIQGQQVKSISQNNLHGYTNQQIPIPDLAAGVYIVEVRAGYNKICRKLLKL